VRRGPTTTERHLGYDHQKTRQAALAAMKDGQACFRCALQGRYHPLSRALIGRSADGKRWVAPLLELDHYPARAVTRRTGGPFRTGLSFKACNRHAGAVLGNKVKAMRRAMVKAAEPERYSRW